MFSFVIIHSMIKDSDFYCQFNSYTNERIAKATCGITSLAMILSAKGVFSRFQNQKRLLDEFFIYINSLHKNDLPSVKRNFKFENKVVPVTLGLHTKFIPENDDFVDVDDVFFPAFVLYKGYDHRASKYILNDFGVSGHLSENLSMAELVDIFNKKDCQYFLASVKSKYSNSVDNTASTHIVVIQKIFENSGQKVMVEYVDPAIDKFENAVSTVPMEDFSKIYNAFGTLVK